MSAAGAGRPRVLVVAGREPWPLDSGGRLRLYHFLRCLVRDAAVTLALPEPAEHGEHLPKPLRIVDMSPGNALPEAPRPAWPGRLARRHFGHNPSVSNWLWAHAQPRDFDAALLYGATTGQYIEALRVPAVWDAVDELVLYTVRDAGRRRPARWLRTTRAVTLHAIFERYVARRAQATVFASPVDTSYARRWAGAARIHTISNGVDFRYFSGPIQPPAPGTVVFVGSLKFPPNVEGIVRFATRIWPEVRSRGAGRRLLIVGREPADAVQAAGRLPGVELHADVPDVRPYLSQAAVVVVPTRLGGGVKNKVLEACAMQRPVVASPRALAGLSARRGRDILCASSTTAWVRHVNHLLEVPAAATRIGRDGYEWVRQAHSWDGVTARLTELLRSATRSRAATRPAARGATCGGGFQYVGL